MIDNNLSALKLRRKLEAIYLSLLRHKKTKNIALIGTKTGVIFRILTFCSALKVETRLCKRCRMFTCLLSKIFVNIIFV